MPTQWYRVPEVVDDPEIRPKYTDHPRVESWSGQHLQPPGVNPDSMKWVVRITAPRTILNAIAARPDTTVLRPIEAADVISVTSEPWLEFTIPDERDLDRRFGPPASGRGRQP